MTDSYVYFVKPVGMDGPIKIGTSRSPKDRLLTLSTWSPFVLEMMGTVPGTSREETMLHRRFADFHTHREWFMSSPLLRQTIERILGGASIKEVCELIEEAGAIRNQTKRLVTDDRQAYIVYARQVRNTVRKLPRKLRSHEAYYTVPDDVQSILEAWCGNAAKGRAPVVPSAEQMALIDRLLAFPEQFAVRHLHRHWQAPSLVSEQEAA